MFAPHKHPEHGDQESNGFEHLQKISLGVSLGVIGFCALTFAWKRCTSGWRNELAARERRSRNTAQPNWPTSFFTSSRQPLLTDIEQPTPVNSNSLVIP